MIIKQERAFKNTYKKLHNNQKLMVDNAIRKILQNPLIGEQKKQDLGSVYVYKFDMNHQRYLLAYTFDPITLTLLLLGVHENFYTNLKIRL